MAYSVTVLANDTYRVTFPVGLVSADPQVDTIDYFIQEAGAASTAPYYYLGSSANAAANYDFSTGCADNSLIVKERIDVDDNPAPASLRDIEMWRGRLFAVADDYNVAYSKQRIDANSFVNIPTSWPDLNTLEVGISCLFALFVVYIVSQRRIRLFLILLKSFVSSRL